VLAGIAERYRNAPEPLRRLLRPIDVDLRELIARQDGVLTLAQAAHHGLNRAAVQRRVTSGEWLRVGRGVYFVADRAVTARARLRGMVFELGDHAVVAGPTAVWWHGITPRAPSTTTICLPRGRHGIHRADVRLIRRDLDPADVCRRNGLAVTSIAMSVLDAAVEQGAAVLDNALLRRRVALDDVVDVHRRYPRRHGAPRADSLIRACLGGARSEAERIAHDLLRSAGITGWRPGVEIGGYEGDVVFDRQRLIVEVDGFAHHSGQREFQRDRTRQNTLVANGWTVLRFTWADLTERPDQVIASIRHALG
jgi:very-short-patch-repair endonuclease